jgi:uncharacterized protein (DUF1501 family)
MNPHPTFYTRRDFLRGTLLTSALSWTVPAFLANTFHALQAAAADSATQTPTGKDSPILVVLQMAGGNDGLNTVVPYANDHYRKARPTLRLGSDAVLKLNDELGLHPSLKGFKALFDAGQLGIVQGIGYPNPNRSHFRSTEIWQTATDSDKFARHGWLGRFFDNACTGTDPTVGVTIGRQMPQAFASQSGKGVSLDNPQNYRIQPGRGRPEEMQAATETMMRLNDPEVGEGANSGGSIGAIAGAASTPGESPLDYLERVALDARVSSDHIRTVAAKGTNKAAYPSSSLAGSLKLVAQLISGGLPTRIYYVSQGGYDTHTNQAPAQQRLLTDLGDGLKAFLDDLKAQGHGERVLVMTFSEFGRRVAENANNGTDHGAAAPMFLAGPAVKAGLLGRYPSLAPDDLLNGDLRYTVDFRDVYAGVLEQWLRTPSTPILGRRFEPLPVAAA